MSGPGRRRRTGSTPLAAAGAAGRIQLPRLGDVEVFCRLALFVCAVDLAHVYVCGGVEAIVAGCVRDPIVGPPGCLA
ncbi:hypothetical protein M501DRAFT_996627 [Patellaria atrata CBS 101060]|uniref:Uncharacterized protein n=1 Tax=Patellaria atrata CBS 101060 TaxID=1346257 RepID=A0A9P4S776_9PEZI|nr:hypothetical protein M501DRAFT_996627 [Patellaria atrata CBS 101060]